MGKNSKIEWTKHTFNPWRGCTKVSPGCANCYAETLSKRNPAVLGEWGPNGTRVVAVDSAWRQPLKWDRAAKEAGERHRVFCASLADVFEDREELIEPRERLFELISETPNLDWLLLTKRPENLDAMLPWTSAHAGQYRHDYWSNVWVGTSVENQKAADERIPHLLGVSAARRFLSMEPLLGPVDLHKYFYVGEEGGWEWAGARSQLVSWVIVGGESGSSARPMHPDWARSIRDQCVAAGVPYHFKQWGEYLPYDEIDDALYSPASMGSNARATMLIEGHHVHNEPDRKWLIQTPGEPIYDRVGKKTAGRLLDGRTWDELPTTN